jgi:hypothetical protein
MDFNNDDNEYGKISMLYKSNLDNPEEKWITEEVDLVPCEDFSENPWDDNFWCPAWTDKHVLFADYYHETTAWLRLLVTRCDTEERAKLNKSCKNDTEIDEYFASNIF